MSQKRIKSKTTRGELQELVGRLVKAKDALEGEASFCLEDFEQRLTNIEERLSALERKGDGDDCPKDEQGREEPAAAQDGSGGLPLAVGGEAAGVDRGEQEATSADVPVSS
jgi:hypothetical protein